MPSACGTNGSSFGVDNAYVLVEGAVPCYTAVDIDSSITALRSAIGGRFGNSTTGYFTDWFGCACLGNKTATVSTCGLQFVSNGSVAMDSVGCLNTVGPAEFLPTVALAAKLGVPAGGVNISATERAFELARDASQAGNMFGPGLFHTALEGFEKSGSGTILASKDWILTDDDVSLRAKMMWGIICSSTPALPAMHLCCRALRYDP